MRVKRCLNKASDFTVKRHSGEKPLRQVPAFSLPNGSQDFSAANEHIRECEAAYALCKVDLQAVFGARK